jgi:SRSO17 transposase
MLRLEVMRMQEAQCSCSNEVEVAEHMATVIAQVGDLLQCRFPRAAAHRHTLDYLRGLIADVERKNGWQLAEYVGYAHPRGIQRVLARYAWDTDGVRDDLRRWVVSELGDRQGVLVVDETGFPKQGRHSVGVARQYCGTLGKIANCQVGVFLAYASPRGHAGIDGVLFVPQEWFHDQTRCRKAGIPPEVGHRTKPQLALGMLEEALDGGVPARWVVADETYGSDGKLRRALERRKQGYVLAVRSNEKPSTWPPFGPPGQVAVADLVATLLPEAWERLSCGEGAQGPRYYDWAYIPIRPALREGWVHALLVRRHPVRTEELAYYLVYAPVDVPLEEVVRAAGSRWTIEEMFKLAKGQVGLDHYEVRSWHGWYRHITLALVALAALVIGVAERGEGLVPATSPSPSPKSGASWYASSGVQLAGQMGCWVGPGGVGDTKGLPRSVIAVAA